MNRKDLRTLSRTRLAEARTLLASGHSDGAYYLAGYAIECALKACIAKGTQRHDFPNRKRVDAAVSQGRSFSDNRDVVQDWSEQGRYLQVDPLKARKLVDAISDRRHRVMKWLIRYW